VKVPLPNFQPFNIMIVPKFLVSVFLQFIIAVHLMSIEIACFI